MRSVGVKEELINDLLKSSPKRGGHRLVITAYACISVLLESPSQVALELRIAFVKQVLLHTIVLAELPLHLRALRNIPFCTTGWQRAYAS